MPAAPIEARVLDALKTALLTIGVVPANWRTVPIEVTESVPADSVPASLSATGPRIYFMISRTEQAEGDVGMAVHWWRVWCTVWVLASSVRMMLDGKADVARALFNNEGAFTTAVGASAYPGVFRYESEMSAAGHEVGMLEVFVDVEISHSAP